MSTFAKAFSRFDEAKIMYYYEIIAMFAKKIEKSMLIYNTTYHVEEDQEKYFLIWIREFYLHEVEKNGTLKAPRSARILSHQEPGSVCYSLQFEVTDSATLHHWYREQGAKLNDEMVKLFKDEVVGFPTLMEVIE